MEDSFKERGLLKISLPRERITPLMIIQKVADGTGEIIGSVDELFSSTTATRQKMACWTWVKSLVLK